MNNILNIIVPPIIYSFYAIPLIYIIYLCKRIIKCDKDIELFMLEKNNIFLLVIYILFPPVLWYRLTYFCLKEKYRILSLVITLFLFLWFIGLLDNLSYFLCKMPYGIYYVNFIGGAVLYIIPVLFTIRYFLIRKDRQDK